MEPLLITPTDETPEVSFDAKAGNLAMKGKCLPEDVNAFFMPILDWLGNYAKQPAATTEFTVGLEYFNTATSKPIIRIFGLLEGIMKAGHSVKVIWCFLEEDEDMQDSGQEFATLVSLPFEERILPD